ncbi:hypothetical protein [Robbsia andropogonis]|nr:hypothetical protein [Robbsia andropogonis]MCP1119350.1 hypothetical protein [Robbsia andropogonis]MCP1129191.1 hypothetical protein [Robbsia andropogonis]
MVSDIDYAFSPTMLETAAANIVGDGENDQHRCRSRNHEEEAIWRA